MPAVKAPGREETHFRGLFVLCGTGIQKNAKIYENRLVSIYRCVYNKTICFNIRKGVNKIMAVIDIIKEKARADKKTIVLPESIGRAEHG